MSKRKKVYFILAVILFMVFFSMTAMAAVIHTTKYWSIPDGTQRSPEQRWTAGITSTTGMFVLVLIPKMMAQKILTIR